LVNILVIASGNVTNDFENSLFAIALDRTLGAVQTYDGLYVHALLLMFFEFFLMLDDLPVEFINHAVYRRIHVCIL